MSSAEIYALQVEEDFREEALDTLNEFQVLLGNINSGAVPVREGMARLGYEIRNLAFQAKAVGMPLVELVLRRFEGYLADAMPLDDAHNRDIEVFLDIVRGLLNGSIDSSADEAEMVRSLPVPRAVDVDEIVALDVEILLVDPQRSAARLFERELRSCGYRVSTCAHAVEAIELAVRTRPDMVITSAVLDDLTGIDLANALVAMPTTAKIPVALLSSFDPKDPRLEHLPETVPLLRKGKEFGADLADALQQYGIT